MTVQQLLSRLRELDIRLWVEGEKLRYNAPQGALTDGLMEELSSQKEAVKHWLKQTADTRKDSNKTIESIPRDRDLITSFAQERLWFLDQLQPNNPYYNMPLVLGLHGELSVDALRASLQLMTQRHESLRTRFERRNGAAVQVIDETLDLSLAEEDLSEYAPGERDVKLAERIRAEALQPFDLARDRLLRARLIRLAPDEHVLLLTMHHIISDGWSLGVLFRELGEAYGALSRGREPGWPALPIQYADFAVWQRAWLAGETLDRQLAYWQAQLADVAPLELPTDRPRPPVQTFNGALRGQELSGELSARLRTFSQRSGVSLFMTLLAGFAVLLQRYSGQDDIVVGSPIANRNRSEIEGLIGFFVNSLVMRTDVSGNPGFDELVERVNRTALGAYEHQDLPFEKLVDELEVERDLGQNPVFQVMFALQNAPLEALSLEGLRLEMVTSAIQTTRFDLEVHVFDNAERLRMGFIYNTDLFDGSTIERMLGHYAGLLESLLEYPERAIGSAVMLIEAERLQLASWNETETDYPRDRTVVSLFEAQAASRAESLAVAYGEETLSYGELNTRANRLAHYLVSNGVSAGDKVGVFLERGVDLVVSLLGILKAGGSYVPLDLDYPASRLGFMLEDAEARVLLSTEALLDRLPAFAGERICLDRDWSEIEALPAENPGVEMAAADLAYVMYTSGSTGIPKGVEIPQRAIARLVCNTDYYQVDATDRVLQASNVSFDAATFELWGSLLNGAAMIGIDKDTFLNSLALADFLRGQEISAMFVTTAVFNQIAREAPGSLSGLRAVMFGGEAVDCHAVRSVLAAGGPARLLHVYGPTESTTFASWYEVESVPEGAVTVPIGRPLANTTLYVLDPQRQRVPVGVPGELYIGGDGLARGYLNRAELTAEKFVANPFDDGETRLYRTGDKVRYRADGAIEFLGRYDHQVKLRGFRIELGEIDSALLGHEALRDAVTIVREDEPGDRRLVSYVVPTEAWVERIAHSESQVHVEEWQTLYEEMYGNVDESQDWLENFAGWNSSYTGEAIPFEEMTEWRESTVSRISGLGPERVLEIGCGTGLLLYRLAPSCARYVGTDFSAVAQSQVRGVVESREEYKNVELWQRTADDFSGVEAGEFDTVVINSVTQYLPSMDYLAAVIEGSVAAVCAGGRIVVGDVRSLPLLKAYHTSVQLYLSPEEAGGGELLRNIQQHVEEENELVIEPSFFHALKQRNDRISAVEVLLKRGRYHNELNGYRYDVVLHVESEFEPLPAAGEWLEWSVLGGDKAAISQQLSNAGEWLGLRGLPNARAIGDVSVLERLQEEAATVIVGELKSSAEERESNGVEPADLWRLAEASGYALELSYTGAGTDGRMDALFRRRRREDCTGQVYWPREQSEPERPWSAYGTNPLKGRLGNALVPQLREDLQERLPEYMVPSVFVVMDALPLNPNGKVDRKALPVPGDVRASLGTEYVAPRDEAERRLAEIWAEVLKLERVGVHDNFFDLGGHSLMATQVVSRIRERLQVELPLAEMFGYPTVAELAPVVSGLQADASQDEDHAIPPADRSRPLPLSFSQERLWFLDQLEPGNVAFNVPGAIRLRGDLDVEALRASLQAIVDRHETLRTVFATQNGEAVQVILAEQPIELAVEDLSALSGEAQDEALQQILNDEALRPFDLAQGPMFRGRLIRLAQDEHVLSVGMHHIASDGWSLGILVRELGVFYGALGRGRDPELPPLPVQYADFAAWQRDWLAGAELERQLAYWTTQLAEVAPLELPTDRPRPPVQTFRGAQLSDTLGGELSIQLDTLCQRQGATPFMTLLAAFAVLLQRYSGQDDIVVGSPIANRRHAQLEDLIGFFVNTLVFRADVSGDPTFEELLARVKQVSLDAYAHQDLPFEMLLEALQPERDRSRNPLFQVFFAVQNAPRHALDLKDLQIEAAPTEKVTTIFDLELHLGKVGEEYFVNLSYNTDLFDAATMERLLEHYRTLLGQIVSNPSLRVRELSLLSESERHLLLEEWNRTERPYPEATLTGLFEGQVESTPEAVALEFGDERLSYAELNARANRLAHHLRDCGVGVEDIVGICLQPGIEMIVGLLGILKSGGAYVPLDPAYPVERLNHMLGDSGAGVLLSDSGVVGKLEGLQGAELHVVCVDRDAEAISARSEANPVVGVTRENLAYVIYTSGSTGLPKGVLGLQKGVVNRLYSFWEMYPYAQDERCCQKTTLNFVDSIAEIFSPLLAGIPLVVIDGETAQDVHALARAVTRERITRFVLVPSLLRALLELDEELLSGLECVRYWMPGGEQLDEELERALIERFPHSRSINMYGASEMSPDVTVFDASDRGDKTGSLIGRPLPNVQVYVLDRWLNPVPVGVPGELYAGGVAVARGYLNRPELTAEKFIANPFDATGESRLYRMGDRVRYWPDGNIEYLGRMDHQVKIRGYRIETGEVESVIVSHGSVGEVVVIAREDGPGEPRLVAYLTRAEDEALSLDALRAHLRQRLPGYMVPSAYVVLEAFPLMPSGKLDRDALPAPEGGRQTEVEYVAPQSELEQGLAAIWQEVLGVERIGVHDNFFDLGGHSLLATRVVSRIRDRLQVDLPLAEMFAYPTVAELVPVIDSLLESGAGTAMGMIESVDRDGPLPLSFAQERLWFLDQLEPGGTAYNLPGAIRLRGDLDIDALRASLQAIVDRHEVLRTVFAVHDDEAAQVIVSGQEAELAEDDLSALAGDAQRRALQEVLREEALQPFDLARDPKLRSRLIRLADDDHVLALCMHHIASDGWSLGILVRELSEAYGALSQGRDPELPALPIQYADFAVWQRGWLTGDELDKQLGYWREALADLPTLELPTDRPRPPVQTYAGAVETLVLDADLSAGLEALSQRTGATPFMTLLAGFAVLLQRYSGQDDIVVGSPIANRNRSEIEDLIGFFVNTLVMRVDASGSPGFEQLVGRVQATALAAYAHQDVPFEKLVEVLQPERDRSRNPLFQVQFALQNAPLEALSLEGLTVEPVSGEVQTTRFDLECHVWSRDGAIGIVMTYNTELFEAATIRRMLGHYANLLSSVVADPGSPVERLEMLDASERRLILEDWTPAPVACMTAESLVAGFEAQVQRDAEAVALESEGEALSYGDLERRANRLARYLQARGVGAEVLVGLYVERSLDLLVGILGILKAGGAYVPLDPDYPPQRLSFMLADSEAALVLTQSGLRGELPEYAGEVICLDTDWAAIEREDEAPLSLEIDADSAAYVIYTSGSTGEPKGVVVTHRNVLRLFAATEGWYGFTDADVWTLFHSAAFDFSVWEIWGALLHGGRLVVVPYAVSRSPERFYELLQSSGVTVLNQTPSAFRQLQQVALGRAEDSWASLRLVIFGGEALDPQSLRPWFERYGEARPQLVNMYGITETTVHVSYRPLSLAESARGASVIGRAIPDLEIYILDSGRRPVPVGVPGELYVGGAGLARGYLKRPELTAERFIAHPFRTEAGARLYRTGDLGRYLADGDIEYLGRCDQQVKLRGFRIELGEIESVLAEQESVREAVVVVRDDGAQGARLVAYLVPGGEAPEIPDLRAGLRARLPEYMVPSAYVVLESMPLTANGKLDRKALPAPEDSGATGVEYVAPRTELEQTLAAIWQEVLGVERIGVHDNFFDLGGHSLLATQVVSRMRDHLQVELPLAELFASPTVAELAPVVSGPQADASQDEDHAISPVDRDGPLPPSFAQERLWFLDQLDPDNPAYNLPGAIRLRGDLDIDALRASLQAIVDRHETLRTVFATQNGEAVQVILAEQAIELAVEDLSALSGEAQDEALQQILNDEALRPFDLAQGPMFRGRLIRLAQDEHVLSVGMHHIASDGWSLGILVRELGVFYGALGRGRDPELPPLPVQYADFAAWQRDWLAGAELERQLAYWTTQLAEVAPLELPTDRPRPPVQTFRGSQLFQQLDEDLSSELESFSRDRGATPFMTLLAAFAVLLQRYSGQDDIVVGSPIANRRHAQLEDLIGFFVNTLVFRADVSGDPTFEELLARVKQVSLDAYAHQDLPFEMLVEHLQLERDRSRNPLFQVFFAVQNAPTHTLDLKGLQIVIEPVEASATHFDLELYVWPSTYGLYLNLVYNTDLFDASTMERLLDHYRLLLGQIVSKPSLRVRELSLLSESERHLLLEEWNRTERPYPEATLTGLFEGQVESTPEAVALEFGDERLSYAELNARANRLAHHLRDCGVGVEDIVGICLQPGIEMIVGLLGILKSGGAYVPLDPAYPVERLNHMLGDSGAGVLLSDTGLLDGLDGLELPDLRLVCVDRDADVIASQSDANLEPVTDPDSLAYVIYTSGSTGEPKGVMGLHRGAVNRLSWMREAYPYEADERCCQKTTLSFVDAVSEIFSPLLSGLPLVVMDGETAQDARALAARIAARGVTRLVLVPSLLRALLELDEELLSGLEVVRYWVTSGERLEVDLEHAFRARFPQAQLINLYGSSEVSADVTCFDTADRGGRSGSLIGRPIANTRAYVLDRWCQLVPVGVPGELYIGGAGLARGYLGREDLTAERFIADPFDEQGGGRLYRTGDVVRYLADGNIEYLGRTDHQVKLRGFRIELGEIESVLAEQESVREAVVVVRADGARGERLVAYLVPDGGEPEANELRAALRTRLPEYMVPSAYVVLDEMPLTASGKLDRKALPAPEDSGATGVEYVAPRTELEQGLAAIWQEVLGVERIGVHDNFFDLGGHSLLATRVVSRMRDRLQVELPLAEMFAYPSVAELAPVIDSLLESGAGTAMGVIEPVDRDGPLPPSFAQERLWFLDQLEPGNVAFNVPGAIRLRGDLDVEALRASLQAIVDRHETLRTVFATQNGEAVQVILAEQPIELAVEDLSALSGEAQDEALQQILNDEALRPFDLAQGPMFRGRLIRLAQDEHVLSVGMHHIASDGWSLGILVRELGVFYGALGRGRDPELPPLPVQYADFAAWQRDWLAGAELERQLAYWTTQLAEVAPLELPTDRPRPPVQTFRGAQLSDTLGGELSIQLDTLCQRQGATPFMTLLAAFAVLLQRYSGQDDIVVGSPIANRRHAQLEDLIGFFVNTLVFRADVSGDPTFEELLARVKQVSLDAYAHQDLPFEMLLEALQPERDRSRNPLFQVFFAVQNAPRHALDLKDLQIEAAPTEKVTTIFDLELHLGKVGEEYFVNLSYNTDLFDAATMERLLDHYRLLLGQIVSKPSLRVRELSLLSESERHLLLEEWNRTERPYPEATLTGLFEGQVESTPEAVALEFGDERLSYAELNARANRLAHHLRDCGVGVEDIVGICLQPGIEMIVGLLGILKSGGAYVPLDPAYPVERLNHMLGDSGAGVLLSDTGLLDGLDGLELPDLRLVCVDRDADVIASQSDANLEPVTDPDSLAYVIYTSGSTGEPKGVMGLHRGAVNRLSWMREAYPYEADERCCQKTTLSFVDAVSEIFSPLLSGLPLVVMDGETAQDARALAARIAARGVTRLVLVPSLLRALLELDEELLSGLEVVRYWVTSGERLEVDLEHAFRARFPQAQLINLYGSSEVSADVTCFDTADRGGRSGSLIGRPIANTRAYVLDRWCQLVPVGVPGELYIGGAGLARGYLGREDLTAERFIADPFDEQGGGRLYRTGDVVRYLADGNIEYLGRTDHQVKLRGFRIELGEIESVLAEQESVREAVVVVRADGARGERLVAYLVPDGGEPEANELRAALRTRLPEYMVPSAYVVLDEMPLTASGKLDRKALPAPLPAEKKTTHSKRDKPETELECILAEIWKELLEVDDLEKDDMFFDLGGHSLLSMHVIDRFAKATGVQLSPANLMNQTLRQLAVSAELSRNESDADAVKSLRRNG